ncbi:probable FMP40 Found in Mitochondrial Proteome [Cephalotrichum gorgonifer]|uniref:Selenoprotein O n=1 Tax=Cephalotrichum gorgonifer TaxID=2041049 RepID=A0AAE8N3H6_9PEZI|nr:probable FMP40 Found in Mitochondrial Proteome [Cephalotrichum gorgonifer]
MASNGAPGPQDGVKAPPYEGTTLADLPKSWTFTSSLPNDPRHANPAESHATPREQFLPRQVHGALYTWVRPEGAEDPELLAVSPAALRDLGIRADEAQTETFLQVVSGNKLLGWDEESGEGGYPWAQCYGGFQFGAWAGQLGDGRAISLFETTNPATGVRYELQLKGAGLTPYSRFADGKAVLRSSIREFVVSEALHSLGIPTTRALSLTLLRGSRVARERVEPGAIVLRFAQSWLRLGSFDLLRTRGDRVLIRQLATYVAEEVLGGWEALPGRLANPEAPTDGEVPRRGVKKDEIEGPSEVEENRFARLYREVVRRNAETVAQWQAYGFMNGVLNTDNTSVMGLSLDFGPFAFMDNFDPSYTPNHDDSLLRYSYKNQPTIIWWNLVRFGEALGELLGAGAGVDDPVFVSEGVTKEKEKEIVARAESIIMQTGEEYKATFLKEYRRLMCGRLGLKTYRESDFDQLFSSVLDIMQELELDFNLFFRRLSGLKLSEISTSQERRAKASLFFYKEGVRLVREDDARVRISEWIELWRQRIVDDWGENGSVSEERDAERSAAMKAVNPNFIPRGWILDEVIQRVEKKGERDVLDRVMHMALHPFEDTWDSREFDGVEYKGDAEEEARWTKDVPESVRSLQCSCSS